MRQNRKQLYLCVILVILNLAFIWGNSMLSAEASSRISDFVKILLTGMTGSDTGEGSGTHLLRKLAHFTEFLLLGMNLCWLFRLLGQKGHRRILLPLLCGSFTACMDETIQLFSPGRSAGLLDVGIDISGLTVGIVLLLLGQSICNQYKTTQQHFGG